MSENKTAKTPTDDGYVNAKDIRLGDRLYAAPKREWVGLTYEEIDILSCEMVKGYKSVNWLCKVLEAKLKEKNT